MSDPVAPAVEAKRKDASLPQSAPWNARWVGPGFDPREDLGIFLFRTTLALAAVPDRARVRVSADQRYVLYVNGEWVDFGPQRGDAAHWFYETLDLAPFLRPGENAVVAVVWNYGRVAPMAQHTVRPGFVLEGLDLPELSTPGSWETCRAPGWDFEFLHDTLKYVYIDVGPGDVLDARTWDPGLLRGERGSAVWSPARGFAKAEERGTLSGSEPWNLVPRTLAPMRHERVEQPMVVRHGFTGDRGRPGGEGAPWTVDADHPLLLDAGELRCAFPTWHVSGPAGTVVDFIYAEAAVDDDRQKGNRNEVEGKHLVGYGDRLILGDGPVDFCPLWWRTFRYVQVSVSSAEPVSVDVTVHRTGYPLEITSSFTSSDPDTQPLWDVAVRTAELCAGETYFDCPYYEQLQYVGDTRIQAQITRYLGRNREMPRNAVRTLAWSQIPEGLTQSRYPSRQMQIIPPFSLWWILMLHDQAFYDTVEIEPEERQRAARILEAWDRLLAADPASTFWCFGDWVPAWNWGVPPGGARASMHRLTLLLARIAYAQLAKKSLDAGRENFRRELQEKYVREGGLTRSVDDPAWEASEHIEALFRVAQRMLDLTPDPWPTAELDAAKAHRCTYYFQYYLHQARPDADYSELLRPWRQQLSLGLTTFAENPEPTRSDCHAWSAHPILGFYQHVAGITSRAVGWSQVRIAPVPGSVTEFEAHLAHPAGVLSVTLRNGRLTVETPVPAEVIWDGNTWQKDPGRHEC